MVETTWIIDPRYEIGSAVIYVGEDTQENRQRFVASYEEYWLQDLYIYGPSPLNRDRLAALPRFREELAAGIV